MLYIFETVYYIEYNMSDFNTIIIMVLSCILNVIKH